MRGGRSLLILVAVAIGLGAYIYFVESERDPLATEARDKVFTVEAANIEEIEVRTPAGETTTVRRNGDDWQIVAPVTAPADETAVSSIADALASTEVTRVLEENPTGLAQFGLEPAKLSVAFKVKGDATPRRLNIGNRTPTGTDAYARVEGQQRLLLVGGFLEDTFNRTTFDLRDKAVLAIEREAVDAVALDRATATDLALARTGDAWRLTEPIAARAEYSPVDGLIGRVDGAQMRSIEHEGAEPTPAQLRTFGLERPQVVATFGSGSARASLAIGAKKDDSSLYARDLSRPLVFTVETSLLTDLEKTPDDFRVKDVFAFKSYSATAIEISAGGTTAAFEKGAPAATAEASTEGTWKQTKPSARDVNQTAMTDLLNTLSSLRAERFVDRAPAAGDDMVVSARTGTGDDAREQVTIRKSGGTAYAIRSDEPGAAVVPIADVDKALGQFKALAEAK